MSDRGAPHSARRALVVNAAELLREPGSLRTVATEVGLDVLDVNGGPVRGPVAVDATLTSMLDGVVADVGLTMRLVTECSRCLRPIDEELSVDAHDTFAVDDGAGEHLPIRHGQLDLAVLVRDSVLLAVPDAPLCRPDCAGLCPVCGVDRNDVECDCDAEVRDDRWAALDALRSDDPASSTGS